jgi:hypothetical protein
VVVGGGRLARPEPKWGVADYPEVGDYAGGYGNHLKINNLMIRKILYLDFISFLIRFSNE